MRKVFVIISLCLSAILAAQTKENYQKEMTKIVVSLDSVKSTEQITNVSNRLAQLNKLFPNEWQPLYYEAYVDLYSFLISHNSDISVLDEAESKIKEALAIEGADKSELWALQGYCMMIKIKTDPMKSGSFLIGNTYYILEKAIKENPENPRPKLVGLSLSIGKKLFFQENISSECAQLGSIKNLMKSEPKTPLTPTWDNSLFKKIEKICLNP